MATKTEDRKIYEPESIEETPLPESVIWQEIIDAPQSLIDLSPTDGAALDAATIAITGLGALAYEDLVGTLQLAANAVTNSKIAVDAIQGAVIAAGAITVTKISDGAIETGKLAANAVTAAKIAAGTITATQIAASTITADKMNVSTLSALTANLGTVTAGAINGLTITGGTIRTASSGTRVEMDSATNELQIYSGSVKRARGYDQGWDYYNSSGTLKGSIYVSSNDMLIAADLTSTGNLYYGVGASGSHSFHVGTGASTIRLYMDTNEMWLGDVDDFTFNLEMFGKVKLYNGLYMNLAGAVVSGSASGGTQAGSMSVNHSATGVYTVTHGLGTSSYTVLITIRKSTATVFAVISSHTSTSFTVRIGDASGVLTDADFEFACFLWN